MKKVIMIIFGIILVVILLLGIFIALFGKQFYSEKQIVSAYDKSSSEISVLKEFVMNKLQNNEEIDLTIRKQLDSETNSYCLYGPEISSAKWDTTGITSVDEAIEKLLLSDTIFDQLDIHNGVISVMTDKRSLDFGNGISYYCGDIEIQYEDTCTVVHKKIADRTYYFEDDVNKARKNGYSLPEKYR